MARETKIGMLIGLGVILLVGIIISDHLSVVQQAPGQDIAQIAQFGQLAERSLDGDEQARLEAREASRQLLNQRLAAERSQPLPKPEELDRQSAQHRATPPAGLRGGLPAMQTYTEEPSNRQTSTQPPDYSLNYQTNNQRTPSYQAESEEMQVTTFDRVETPDRRTNQNNATSRQSTQTTENWSRDETGRVIHYVREGESLSDVARIYLGDASRYTDLIDANPHTRRNPNFVSPGTRLVIPLIDDRAQTVELPRESSRQQQNNVVTVESGDSLIRIAKQYLGDGSRWEEIYELNRDQLDRPEALKVGMKIKLPAITPEQPESEGSQPSSRAADTYTVKTGDNLASIAGETLGDRTRWREIFEANQDQLSDPDAIRVGQTLHIPR